MGAVRDARPVQDRLRAARAVLDRVHGSVWSSTEARADVGLGGAEGGQAGVIPVAGPLRGLLPAGGLRRGGTVEVASAGSLLFALLAEASRQGSWCALVGLPELGLVAAAEAGLELSRVALVPRPGARLVEVAAALLDGMDLVVVAGAARLPSSARQLLAARARQRGAVLLSVGRWPGADLEIGCSTGTGAGAEAGAGTGGWRGMAGAGAGRLRCRDVRVRVSGRGAAHRGRSARLLLPGPSGAVEVGAELAAEVGEEAARGVRGPSRRRRAG
jgi:hypothetical protein